MDRIVHKFGGTSLGSADRIANAAGIAGESSKTSEIIIVVSAMAGVTNRLEQIASAIIDADLDAALEWIEKLETDHIETLGNLSAEDPSQTTQGIKQHFQDLKSLARGARLLGHTTAKARDHILAVGEKLSALLFVEALKRVGLRASAFPADQFLLTDQNRSGASPLSGIADRAIVGRLLPALATGEIPVVTGFCGLGPDGETTLLGRGGSDLTATYIAAAIDADQVIIWTDVDGVFSADPANAPEARVIPQLNYREATEMSYYGARVLHARSILPVVAKAIPVTVRNSLSPTSKGTRVDGTFTPGSHPVKAISAIHDQCLMSVEGNGMSGVPGVAARVFQALADDQISVTMISQSSSESTICFALPKKDALRAEARLKRVLVSEMSSGIIEEIVVNQDVGLVAAVGLGMSHAPGVAARLFSSLGKRQINVLAIAQGSSELNISLAVERRHVAEAVQTMHAEFGLDRIDTGHDSRQSLDLILLGCGNVGRALIDLVFEQRAEVFSRFGLTPRIVAIADRSGYILEPSGLSRDRLRQIFLAKDESQKLSEIPEGVEADSLEMISSALGYRLSRPILVDVSIAENASEIFAQAFAQKCDVVTANKIPLSGPLEEFRALTASADTNNRILRTEATVGSGMPVMDTLEMLLATGDQVSKIEGCLSGTLGYLMGQMESGEAFSAAVAQAVDQGYTEPDPVTDLAGTDMARKAIILGRLSGLITSDIPVQLEGLVDSSLAGKGRDELLQELKKLDAMWAERIARAKSSGNVIRYLAVIESDSVTVGPAEIPGNSPFGLLQATDNMIVFRSQRYNPRPLVITGPGAGIDVTAMGVLADIIRIAADRS